MVQVYMHPSGWEEKAYTLHVLFEVWMGVPIQLNAHDLLAYHIELPKGKICWPDALFARMESGEQLGVRHLPKAIKKQENPFENQEPLCFLYGADMDLGECRYPLHGDLVASAFFMLSRWEEAVRPELDQFGRLPSINHTSVAFGLDSVPFLDDYRIFLERAFIELGYLGIVKQHQFSFELSCDVDVPQLWPNGRLGLIKTFFGALLKRQDLKECAYWLKKPYQAEHQHDPCDTFEMLMDLGDEAGKKVVFHFLGERPKAYDHYYSLDSSFITDLMQRVKSRGHEIGFHPSREAAKQGHLFRSELEGLQRRAGKITKGRHHYLAIDIPDTWSYWEENGLELDSSLGFIDRPGFRCGTTLPFPVFDFAQRRKLKVFTAPLVCMDVASVLYQRLSPDEAYSSLLHYLAAVKKRKGNFTLLWHNSSFFTYPWYAYRQLPKKLISQL